MIRGRSLSWKLSALIMLTFLVSFLVNALIVDAVRGRPLRDARHSWSAMQARLAVRILEPAIEGAVTDSQLQTVLDRAFRDLPELSVLLLDMTGRVCARTGQTEALDPSEDELRSAVEAAAARGIGQAATPAWSPPVGVLRVGTSQPAFFAAVSLPRGAGRASMLPPARLLFGAPLLLLVASGIAGALAIRLFLRRLRGLEQGVSLLGKGDLSYRIDPGPADEVGRLGEAFNAMAGNLEKAMKELSAQDQARREILADVAHELRTPLTSMLCQVQSLQEQEDCFDVRVRDQLRIIAEDGFALGQRIKDLLALSREGANAVSMDLHPSDLTELLRSVVEHFLPICAARGVSLTAQLPACPTTVEMDRDRMAQVFENLVTNAVQCLADGGAVTLRTLQGKGEVGVEFADTGPGISPEELPTIFERFRRGQGSRGPGTGLGLAIVKKFVESHGGRCLAESTLGAGSRFTVWLPLPAA